MQIVDDNEVVQTVTVQIRRVEQADLVINGIRFMRGEIETVRRASAVKNEMKNKKQRRQNGAT